jgi:hypothetical protein
MTRIIPALAALALLVAACGDGRAATIPEDPEPGEGPGATTSPAAPSTLPVGPSALDDPRDPAFPEPLVDVAEIISGGPPPDGIPPIDDPEFASVEAADEWLDDAEAVIVLEIGGEARAYPVQILIWHEIVNDTVGGTPVAVTYCPLCNSAVTYRRAIDGAETTFGTSGRLFASALVMYDRATESLWTHFDGRAVVGMLTGTTLEPVASPLISWADFKASHPGGRVLDRNETGHTRPYGTNPYVGYDDPNGAPFLFTGALDDRAFPKQRVVGVTAQGESAAWTLGAISNGEAQATNAELGGRPLVILWKAGQSSALDTRDVEDGTDVGSIGVFDPVVDGSPLTFAADGDGFVDEETGSRWSITGAAVAGELAGTNLERIPHLDTFWFAWSTYRPGTTLIEE